MKCNLFVPGSRPGHALCERGDDVQRLAAAFQHRAADSATARPPFADHVEAMSILSDVEGAIVDDLAHAYRQCVFAPGRAAIPDDVGALHERNLHCRASNPAQTPDEEDRPTRFQLRLRHHRVPGRHALEEQGGPARSNEMDGGSSAAFFSHSDAPS